jgi:hypothetical protein
MTDQHALQEQTRDTQTEIANISTQQPRLVPRNIFRRCKACLENGGRRFEILLEIQEAELHGTDRLHVYQLPEEASFS